MRTVSLFLALSLFAAAPVSAQTVTDAERAAARQLFSSGDQHQQKGEYAEALDDFQKAQRIFSAPTNLLRIAQCQAALGRLVEASETYRQIIRAPLPPGSPPAFSIAVDQAKQELPQVEPRVPKLKIEVQPKDVPNLSVAIDGTPVNAALVGELLPWNPGTRKVTVFAPGYASSEQTVQLKERETKVVSFNLVATGGVVYTNPNDPNPARPVDPNPGGNTTPPPPPPPIEDKPRPVGPVTKANQTSLVLGAHLGVNFPVGDLGEFTFQDGSKRVIAAGDEGGTGGALGLDVGVRFARNVILHLVLERSFFGSGGNAQRLADSFGSVDSSASASLLGVLIAYVTNPDKASFYIEGGAGYRWFNFTRKFGGGSLDTTLKGGEFLIGTGVWIPAGDRLRLLPKIQLGAGSYGEFDEKCTGFASCGADIKGEKIPNSKTHGFVMLGLVGYFNADF